MTLCRVCGMEHITHRRSLGQGFVCDYRLPTEHYHDTEEERLVLCGDGNYTPQQYERAATAMQRRTGTRGKHARKRSVNKPRTAA